MTDLEITRLCAKAAGVTVGSIPNANGKLTYSVPNNPLYFSYDPLHDDEQAMALVKKFRLRIGESLVAGGRDPEKECIVERTNQVYATGKDLNQCICECVAKMQTEKVKSCAS